MICDLTVNLRKGKSNPYAISANDKLIIVIILILLKYLLTTSLTQDIFSIEATLDRIKFTRKIYKIF